MAYQFNPLTGQLDIVGSGGGGGGTGTVTQVGLTMPSVFAVAGSPVTTVGTFAVTLATQTANTVWAGPASGAAATPTFRTLTAADFTVGGGANRVLFVDSTNSFIDNSASFTYVKGTTAFNLQSTNAGIGDTAGTGNDTKIQIVDSTGRITLTSNDRTIFNAERLIWNDSSGNNQLAFAASVGTYQFGDLDFVANGTYLSLDDISQELLYDGSTFRVTGGNLTYNGIEYIMPSIQGTAGQVLSINSVTLGVATLAWAAGGGSGAIENNVTGTVAFNNGQLIYSQSNVTRGSDVMIFNDTTNILTLSTATGTNPFLTANATTRTVSFGDLNNSANNFRFVFDDTNQRLRIFSGSARWFAVEPSADNFGIGDLGGFGNGTAITLSDGIQQIDLLAPNITLNTVTYAVPLADGSPGDVLTTNGAGTLTWAAAPSGFADPMTTIGDIIIRNGTNTTARLGIGTTGQVLTVGVSGVPAWASAPPLDIENGVTTTSGFGSGNILFNDVTNTVRGVNKFNYDTSTDTFQIDDGSNPFLRADPNSFGFLDFTNSIGTGYGLFSPTVASIGGDIGGSGPGAVLNLDYSSGTAQLGDVNGLISGTNLTIDYINSVVDFNGPNGSSFNIQTATSDIIMGDIAGASGVTLFEVNDSSQYIRGSIGGRRVLNLDRINELYQIGRITGGNISHISINDSARDIALNSRTVTLSGVAYDWPNADGTSGQVLTTSGTGVLSWTSASGGVTTVGTINSVTPSANGAVISGSNIIFQSASATEPGMVDLSTQVFTGLKAFVTGLETVAATITGTGGAGYIDLFSQASTPAAPSTSFLRLWQQSNRMFFSRNGGIDASLDFNSITSDRNYAFPDAAGTVVLDSNTVTITNKTIQTSTLSGGALTMSLGSDATGDIYYRNSSGFLTRLAIGSTGQVLSVVGGLPSWAAGGSGMTALPNTQIYVGNVSNVATAVAMSGDATIANTGALTVVSASDTVAGKVELATITETNTGTDATRAVTPDGLSQSYAGTKNYSVQVFAANETVLFGNGVYYFRVPPEVSGMKLVGVGAANFVASNGSSSTFQFSRGRQSTPTTAHTFVSMLSTVLSIDDLEYDSKDATTPPVINTSNDDVLTGDLIRVDVVTAGTNAEGLFVTLSFRLP